jgi:hypothetical protein
VGYRPLRLLERGSFPEFVLPLPARGREQARVFADGASHSASQIGPAAGCIRGEDIARVVLCLAPDQHPLPDAPRRVLPAVAAVPHSVPPHRG